MITDLAVSNRFQVRNDWQVKSFLCKKSRGNSFEQKLCKIIYDELKFHPFADVKYRGRNVVKSRQVFMVMMVTHTKESYSSIAGKFGQDHSLVNHALKAVSDMCDTDKHFRESFNKIQTKVKLIA